jgi:hypothetical protein
MPVDMVEKINSFNLNEELLLRELVRVQEMYKGHRIRITHSDLDNEFAPCDVTHSPSNTILADMYKETSNFSMYKTWNSNNILKPFQKTYTEKFVKEVDQWLSTIGLRCTMVKFWTLKEGTCWPLHSDPEPYRYHIPLKTNIGSMMVVDDKLYTMPEIGSLYKMRIDVLHTAINAGASERVHLVFDVTEI